MTCDNLCRRGGENIGSAGAFRAGPCGAERGGEIDRRGGGDFFAGFADEKDVAFVPDELRDVPIADRDAMG